MAPSQSTERWRNAVPIVSSVLVINRDRADSVRSKFINRSRSPGASFRLPEAELSVTEFTSNLSRLSGSPSRLVSKAAPRKGAVFIYAVRLQIGQRRTRNGTRSRAQVRRGRKIPIVQ